MTPIYYAHKQIHKISLVVDVMTVYLLRLSIADSVTGVTTSTKTPFSTLKSKRQTHMNLIIYTLHSTK